jgi:hypothetical protein
MLLKDTTKSVILSFLAKRVPWGKLAFSQFGEDVALRSTLRYCGLETGFYLDVGAYHPAHLSNTFALYQAGWCGITVEPNAAFTDLFRTLRPRDVHLQCVASPDDSVSVVPFYSFGPDSVYNTLSRSAAEQAAGRIGAAYSTLQLPARSLNGILNEYLPPGRRLDLLCLDCEGADEDLLQSFDWKLHKPAAVVFEQDGVSYEDALELPTVRLLRSFGYQLIAKTGPSLIARLPRDVLLGRNTPAPGA